MCDVYDRSKLLAMESLGELCANRRRRRCAVSSHQPGCRFHSHHPQQPTITLIRGLTYTFALSTSGIHPFTIGTTVSGPAPAGVSGNNNSSSGTITFKVPTNAVDCVYFCSIHHFNGKIHMIDPPLPSPPAVTIVGLKVGANVLLTSTQSTTNGFSFIPQANTDLTTTNWFALTVQSNSFANGTNEIICGKPPGNAAFFRILIQ